MPPNKPGKHITASATKQLSENDVIFFFLPKDPYGEFCQWYPSKFAVAKEDIRNAVENHDGVLLPEWLDYIQFNCAEQFMMYCKAARFGDVEGQRRVLATDNAKEQKRLGKLTAGFNEASWDMVKSAVVETGNMAKFGQNTQLRLKLLATENKVLCEAASQDRVWGIGYTAHQAIAMQAHWGENRLGKALMAVRERLRSDGRETTATSNDEQMTDGVDPKDEGL